MNCQRGEKNAAAKYIEQGIAALKSRSRSVAADNTLALQRSIEQLRYQSSQLNAGRKVSVANLKSAIAGVNRSFVDSTHRVTHNVGARSNKVVHASADFGHRTIRDAERDVRYTGNRVKLLGSRVGDMVLKTVSPVSY